MLNILRGQKSLVSGAKEHIAMCDLPGFAEFCGATKDRNGGSGSRSWCGGMTFAESLKAVQQGDEAGVEPSEKIMAQVESFAPPTKAWERFMSVSGGVVSVPLYLAGEPLNMIARRRTGTKTAPLSVFVDLVSSAAINADDMKKRGAAILALVRTLAAMRAVELHAIVGIGDSGVRATVAIRIETAPLDLSRAAHILTHPSVARALGYASVKEQLLAGYWSGAWPFGDHDKHRKTAREAYRDFLNPGSEVFMVPAIYAEDESITNPVKWMSDNLAKYGGIAIEDDAA